MYDTHEQHIYDTGWQDAMQKVVDQWKYVQEGEISYQGFTEWLILNR